MCQFLNPSKSIFSYQHLHKQKSLTKINEQNSNIDSLKATRNCLNVRLNQFYSKTFRDSDTRKNSIIPQNNNNPCNPSQIINENFSKKESATISSPPIINKISRDSSRMNMENNNNYKKQRKLTDYNIEKNKAVNDLNLIQKTSFLEKSKQTWIQLEREKRKSNEMKECTFHPRLNI